MKQNGTIWTLAIVIGIICLLVGGCATGYIAGLRHEFAKDGVAKGVYFDEKEYPSVYPATRIAVFVEIPTWWWPRKTELEKGYASWLWPIGAPLSIVDVVCSIVSDTVMLPYDTITTKRGKDT